MSFLFYDSSFLRCMIAGFVVCIYCSMSSIKHYCHPDIAKAILLGDVCRVLENKLQYYVDLGNIEINHIRCGWLLVKIMDAFPLKCLGDKGIIVGCVIIGGALFTHLVNMLAATGLMLPVWDIFYSLYGVSWWLFGFHSY